MNLLFQSLCSLFPPRLPRFGPEDVAATAEYYNRLARHHEANITPPGMWIGRIATERAARMRPFKAAEKVPQKILRRAASQESWEATCRKMSGGLSRRKSTVVLASSSASARHPWPKQALTSNRKLLARPVWMDKDQLLPKVLNWARRLRASSQRFIRSATFAKAFLLWR